METSLYLPVKRFLEARGFAVKGEVCGCDLVALGGDGPTLVVIGELKQSFTLELLLQGIDRQAAGDEVWLAVRATGAGGRRGRGRERDPRVRKACRLLGLGLLAVFAGGQVEILADPGPYSPRANKARRGRLVAEHRRRQGDPAVGGGTRIPIMTAYRQQALIVAAGLSEGPRRPRDLKPQAPDAGKILLDNVYGWFERVERGVYGLTEAGRTALARWLQAA